MVETYLALVFISLVVIGGLVLLYIVWTVLVEDEDNERIRTDSNIVGRSECLC